MKEIKFFYNNCLISEYELEEAINKLKIEIENMNLAIKEGYENDRASINLPNDKQMHDKVKQLIKKQKQFNPKYIVVVGIGGSNLGTIAVQEAVLGKLYNQRDPDIKIIFADTVDSDLIYDIISIIEPLLKKGENIVINGVSKSGGTTETIANFEALVNIVKKYKNDYQKYIVVTTDKNSNFWNLANKKGFDVLEIPKKVGGRFSVFSSVGLFPLGLIGIDIDELISGARLSCDKCLTYEVINNPAALSACLIYIHNKKGKNIHDMFLFSPDLESIGKWYRQLMGESMGKEFNREQKKVFCGITPTVSIGSTDLHSMAQLYLGGPNDKFTTFIRVLNNKENVKIPNFQDYSKLVNNIQDTQLSTIMNAILEGVQISYKKGERPFVEIDLPDKSPSSIGQFLQMKMMEMMYLGFLMNVNPFDQPNVEYYKIETKKILIGKNNISK